MSALDDNPTVLMVRKHLVEHLGPPDEVFELNGSPVPNSSVQALNLAYFAPQGPQAPVVFATCGASLHLMKDGRRVEGLMLLRREPPQPAFEAIQRVLAQFALFSESSGEPVRLGDVVRAPDMLRPFCPMDAVLFMPPVPFVPAFHRAAIGPEAFVDLVWLLPVFEAEAAYAMDHGPQALMMLFAAQELDLTDPGRAEANTLVDPAEAEAKAKQALEASKNQPTAATPSAGKPKTSRRDVNKGSFNVDEAGNTLRITRRGGARAAKPAPSPAAPPRAAPPAEPEAPAEPKPAGRPGRGPSSPRSGPQPRSRAAGRPPRRPAVVQVPSKKEEVRFDLGAKAPTPKRAAPAQAAARPKPPPPMTEEQKAEAKRRRVEALKAKAKEAAERAVARTTGEMKAAPPKAAPAASEASTRPSSTFRAAKRRGPAPQATRPGLPNDED